MLSPRPRLLQARSLPLKGAVGVSSAPCPVPLLWVGVRDRGGPPGSQALGLGSSRSPGGAHLTPSEVLPTRVAVPELMDVPWKWVREQSTLGALESHPSL